MFESRHQICSRLFTVAGAVSQAPIAEQLSDVLRIREREAEATIKYLYPSTQIIHFKIGSTPPHRLSNEEKSGALSTLEGREISTVGCRRDYSSMCLEGGPRLYVTVHTPPAARELGEREVTCDLVRETRNSTAGERREIEQVTNWQVELQRQLNAGNVVKLDLKGLSEENTDLIESALLEIGKVIASIHEKMRGDNISRMLIAAFNRLGGYVTDAPVYLRLDFVNGEVEVRVFIIDADKLQRRPAFNRAQKLRVRDLGKCQGSPIGSITFTRIIRGGEDIVLFRGPSGNVDIEKLRAIFDLIHMGDKEALEEACKLVGVPQFPAAIEQLSRYGYSFHPDHFKIAEKLISQLDGIIEGIREIRLYDAGFQYQPWFVFCGEKRMVRYGCNPFMSFLLQRFQRNDGSLLDAFLNVYEREGEIPRRWSDALVLVGRLNGSSISNNEDISVTTRLTTDEFEIFNENLSRLIEFVASKTIGGSALKEMLKPPIISTLLAFYPVRFDYLCRAASEVGSISDCTTEVAQDIGIALLLLSGQLTAVCSGAGDPFKDRLISLCVRLIVKQHPGKPMFDRATGNPTATCKNRGEWILKQIEGILAQVSGGIDGLDYLEEIVSESSDQELALLSGLIHTAHLIKSLDDLKEVCHLLKACCSAVTDDARSIMEEGLAVCKDAGWLDNIAALKGVLDELTNISKSGYISDKMWSVLRNFNDSGRFSEQSLLGNDDGAKELRILHGFMRDISGLPVAGLYSVYRRIALGDEAIDGYLDKELAMWGVDTNEKSPLAKLREAIKFIMANLLKEDAVLSFRSELSIDILLYLCRVWETRWIRTDRDLREVVKEFAQDYAEGKIQPLSRHYREGSFWVATHNASAVARFEFSDSARAKVEQIRRAVFMVRNKAEKQVIREQIDILLQNIAERIGRLNMRAGSMRESDAEGKRGIKAELERWYELREKVKGVRVVEQLIGLIAEHERRQDKATSPVLMRLLIYAGLKHSPSASAVMRVLEGDINHELLSTLIEFFEGEILGKAVQKVGLSKEACKRVKQVCSVKVFRDELERMSRIQEGRKERILVLPTRGILGEFSGYISDTCWTKQRNIMREYPHMTAAIFVIKPDTTMMRLGGATLLIESEDTDSNKIIIIRGFNPLQNIITKVNVGDFFEKFLDWLEPIARSMGASKIVIPYEESSGGAQTNRSDVNVYISGRYKNARLIRIRDRKGTTFNGYDIADICVVVREITPQGN